MATLKPFYINLNDLVYLLQQVNFVPLFDGPANSNGLVAFDGSVDAYSATGVLLWDASANAGAGALTAEALALGYQTLADLGAGFPHVSAPVGIRDVSGLHNNLFGTQADWGAVDVPFRRDIAADFTNYVTTPGADYTPGNDVIDLMPRMISRMITTAGVNLLQDASGAFVEWDPALYASGSAAGLAYKALIDGAGVNIAQLVEGAKIVAPVTTEITVLDYNGAPLVWHLADYQASIVYTTTMAVLGASSYGGLMDAAGGALEAGEQIWYRPIPGGALVNTGQTYQPAVLAYKQLIDANVDFSGGYPAEGTGVVTTLSESGYGLLETLGHIDFQNPASGEFFIGSENPGVAPVNSWFGIFGQFLDHGLDLIGKGGNGKITIALDPSDPLYRAPGTNGPSDPGVTKMTVTRATIAGTDANGDPNYANHTSPFIDQSQTYGSVDQITQLLREWVPDSDGSGFHAGMTLFDGTTLEDAWERRWPDGTSEMVHNTLPTLNELRDHVADTGRAFLNWDDVGNYRNRDASGQLADSDPGTAGIQASGSGHALLLDMNPVFDAAHLASTQAIGSTTVGALVAQAVIDLNASIDATITNAFGTLNPGRAAGGDSLTQSLDGSLNLHLGTDLVIPAGAGTMTIPAGDYGGANAMMLWIDFSTFSVMAPPASVENAAVGEILMAAVGDHYIAGDGRVNENFGLTSIHHVFHEEHNFQVENLKTWIYAHDANNSPVDHAGLHAWQTDTGTQDANGNYLDVNGDIAWDMDKMFNATKLIVEMEYQHAAVDQYARTVTPRIQEFVGYSTGVDSTISLEYSQVAFRFGHSTIRETIDAVDPSGWMMGNVTRYALEKAFLNPGQFAETGVAAITLGLARQQMNEVDEFVTPALTQGLLDQPLDLPAINIARGRDLGIPTLNDFREAISLARYTSWDDYGKNMIHPESLVNFIAAYSFGSVALLAGMDQIQSSQAHAAAMLGLYDGSIAEGDADALGYTAAEATAFMLNNATANANLDVARDGFNHIDAWIGGLAEAHVPGGLLGETFDAVFVAQIQSLMDGDRFYYLYRLFGTNLHEEVNNGQFKDIVERNTGLSHLNGSIFAYADKYYDFNRDALPPDAELHTLSGDTYYTDANGQLWATRTGSGTVADPYVYSDKVDASNPPSDWALFNASNVQVSGVADHGFGLKLAENPGLGMYSDGGASLDPNGSTISVTGSDFVRADVVNSYIRDVRPELDPTQVHTVEGTPTSGADSHEVIVATENADYIHARSGDDTVYGEGGNDYIYGDGGVDRMYGGDGHDMIDTGEGPDLADGGAGKDIIYGRGSGSEVGGFDQLVGGTGNDLIIGGEGIDKLSGGSGDDIIYGDGLTNPEMGNTDAFTHGGDGNDYIDTGASGDLLFGEEGDDYLVGGIDQDLMQGGSGDDIIRPGSPSQASGTTGGPDEVVGDDGQANASFDLIDLSDYAGNAPGVVFDFSTQNNPLVNIDQTTTFPAWFQIEGAIGSQNDDTFIGDSIGDPTTTATFLGSNWLIGGSGNDEFTGNGGNDVMIGGSIRLDDLIGQYADVTVGNLVVGSQAWLAEAMDITAGGTGYDNNEESAYNGASNRTGDADGLTSGGLIEAINATIANAADHFAKHFTDMLKSRMFKDVVLGDNGTDGTVDTMILSGAITDYTFTAVSAGAVGGWKVEDLVAGRDGIDLIVGIESLQFNGALNVDFAENGVGAIALAGLTNLSVAGGADAAQFAIVAGELTFAASPNFEAPADAGADNVYQLSVQGTDVNGFLVTHAVNVTVTNVDEAGTNEVHILSAARAAGNVVTVTGQNVVNDPDVPVTPSYLWSNGATTAVANIAATNAVQTITLSGGYTDALGTHPNVPAPEVVVVGTAGNDGGAGSLAGTAGADWMFGLGGNDTYVVNHVGDTVNEVAGEGTTDTVQTSLASYTLGDNVENLSFSNGAAADISFTATGNALANNLSGGSANDTFVMIVDNARDDVSGGGGGNNGVDTADYSAYTANLTVNLGQGGGGGAIVNGSGTDPAGPADNRDRLQSIENFIGGSGNDDIAGGQGNNSLAGGAGDDVIRYNVTTQGGGGNPPVNSGRDLIDGGGNTGTGDRFILTGTGASETFRIFTAAAAATAGITGLAANTEIVITRNGTIDGSGLLTGATVLAELDNIEEITVNALDTTVNDGNGVVNGGAAGGDTVAVFGSFTSPNTSLNYSTITINGGLGNDTVDITGLTSDHRIVFNSNGGYDTVVGTPRAQDVIDWDDVIAGTAGRDALEGGQGNDWMIGLAGNDRLLGGTGNDTLKGGAGRDLVNGGDGNDKMSGGAGGDIFVFRPDFGRDVVTDFDANPAGGQDLLVLRDMGITAGNFAEHVKILNAGADTLVVVDGQQIRLAGVADHLSVTVDDFRFG